MKKGKLGWYIIGSAIIWGVVILLVSRFLGDYEGKSKILFTIGDGAAIHLLLIWVPLAAALRKKKTAEKA